MSKIATGLLIVAAAAVFAITASAAPPLFLEDFSYASSSQLNGQGGWAAHSGAGTNPLTVNASAGLSYTGYLGSGVGNGLGTTATSGEDDNHSFTGQTSGNVYAAFMVNVVSSQTTGDYFFHFFDGLITGNIFRGRVFVKKDAASSNYAFGIQFGSTINTVYTGFDYTPGTTYLVVLKYAIIAGANNDVVSIVVNPPIDCAEAAATVSATDVGQTDAANLDGVAIRQGSAANAATVQIDGIRVATNWGDALGLDCPIAVTPVPWGTIKNLYR
jgi:hypothetical protein